MAAAKECGPPTCTTAFECWAIEYRFSSSSGALAYNLTDAPIWRRDGASRTLMGNVMSAAESRLVTGRRGRTSPPLDGDGRDQLGGGAGGVTDD